MHKKMNMYVREYRYPRSEIYTNIYTHTLQLAQVGHVLAAVCELLLQALPRRADRARVAVLEIDHLVLV